MLNCWRIEFSYGALFEESFIRRINKKKEVREWGHIKFSKKKLRGLSIIKKNNNNENV